MRNANKSPKILYFAVVR